MKLSEKINRLNKIEEILSKIEKKGLTDALINRIVSLFDGGFSVGMNIAYKEKLLQEKEKLLKEINQIENQKYIEKIEKKLNEMKLENIDNIIDAFKNGLITKSRLEKILGKIDNLSGNKKINKQNLLIIALSKKILKKNDINSVLRVKELLHINFGVLYRELKNFEDIDVSLYEFTKDEILDIIRKFDKIDCENLDKNKLKKIKFEIRRFYGSS